MIQICHLRYKFVRNQGMLPNDILCLSPNPLQSISYSLNISSYRSMIAGSVRVES